MNIGIFTDTYFPQISGVAASIATLDKELTRLGHNVYIFTSTDNMANTAKEKGKVFRFPSLAARFVPERRLAFKGTRRASHLIKTLNIDVIHTQTEFSMGWLGKHLSRKHQLPFIHTYHTMYEDYIHYIAKGRLLTPSMIGKLTKWFCRRADLVIAPTEKVKRTLERYQVAAPIKVAPTGISLKQFQRTDESVRTAMEIKAQIGLSADDPVVVSIGRMAEEKNMQALIQAVKDCHSNHVPMKLVLVGDGPERHTLEELANTLGVSRHVLFVGAINWNKIHYYYQISDLFVSASTTEAQGLTYIEAMASGCAVIAKDDSSIQTVIRDGESGFVFKQDSDLAPLLMSLWQNPQRVQHVQSAAHGHVRSFSAESFGLTLESTYQVVSQKGQTTQNQRVAFYPTRRSS